MAHSICRCKVNCSQEQPDQAGTFQFNVQDLTFSYDGEKQIFNGLNLELTRGKITTLIGANGSGKSTLFNLMTKNLVPSEGSVLFGGANIDEMKLSEFSRLVAIVHQNNTAPDDIAVETLVSYGRFPFRHCMGAHDPAEDERMVQWALETTGLSEYAHKAVSALSGGQRQRVWIAMALAQGTDTLLLDEPTTYLDIRYQLDILDLVKRLNRELGMTIVMVLHDINQALYYSDEIVALADGRIVTQGEPQAVISKELLAQVYGVDLDVVDVDGKPFVINANDCCEGEGLPHSCGMAPSANVSCDEVQARRERGLSERAVFASEFRSCRAGVRSGQRGLSSSVPTRTNEADLDGDPEISAGLVKEPAAKSRSKLVRGLWAAAGFLSFALGAIGVVLPFIPTTPLILLAAFCFVRSSERINNWFKSTKLYHTVLEGFVTKRTMTVKAKLSIIIPVTVLMAIGFMLMGAVPIGRIVLAAVWIGHIVYFGFIMKTDKQESTDAKQESDASSPAKKKDNPMIKTRLLGLLSDARKYIVYQVAWRMGGLVCQIVIVLWAATLLDRAFAQQLDTNTVIWCAACVVPAILMRVLCDRQTIRASYLASADVKRVLRDRIYRKLLELGAAYRESVSSSKVIQLAVEGVEQLEVYFGQYLSQLFYALLAPITLFAVLAFVDIKAAAVLLVFVPVIPLSIVLVQKIAQRLLSKYWGIYTDLGESFLENLQGLTTLKIYQADEGMAEKMNAASERFRVVTMQVLKMQLNSTTIMDIGAYGGAAAGITVALFDFFAGGLSVFGLVAITLLAAEFFLPMRRLGSYFHIAMNGMAASDNIFELLDMPVPDQETGGQHIEGEDISIELDDVSFSYDGERPAIAHADMQFPRGSFKALVGVSGCGKSTIAKLIMGRSSGYEGSIRVNDVELSDVQTDEIMRSITMVSHASHLFKGTVRDNLLLADPVASDAEMESALARVRLLDFLETQEGLDTVIEEGASNLSGGQRQRLALARALLHDTPAYIFDEATSSVDVESEELIMEVVRELAQTRTVILISHRLANVVEADEIYYIDHGKVLESGTHEELLAQTGAYAHLFNQQMELESYAGANRRFDSASSEEVCCA